MSKQIDSTKIERIREAAVACIGRHGIGNTSVAMIAAEAGVSVGYLYRHYTGKDELINDILSISLDNIGDKVEALISSSGNTREIVHRFVAYLLSSAKDDPDKVKFILSLQNDFSFSMSEVVIERISRLCNDILTKGQKAIRPDITAEDMYVILICMPLQYIGDRMRNLFGRNMEQNDITEKITAMCMAAIR